MAVELSRLYQEICAEYEVKLLTTGCFGKKISWVHTMEDRSFAYLLHGDELIFNSGLNYDSEDGLKKFIDSLLAVHAGGLVVAVQKDSLFSDDIVEYCNRMQFPLFYASWQTSYLDIMHRFSEMIISDERNETNLIAALKNAIYYPGDDKLYMNHFERNGFFSNMPYIITVVGCRDGKEGENAKRWKRIEKSLQYALRKSVIYEEALFLVVLAAGYEVCELKEELARLCKKESDIRVAIGSVEKRIQDIHRSYENAVTTYSLASKAIPKELLCYEELGIYQILTDKKDEMIYQAFVEKTLGKLLDYDREQGTNYIGLLEIFFENECNLTQTASALFFHKNTLKYKMQAIKKILGYDIMSNKNRVNIMLSLYILRMEKG